MRVRTIALTATCVLYIVCKAVHCSCLPFAQGCKSARVQIANIGADALMAPSIGTDWGLSPFNFDAQIPERRFSDSRLRYLGEGGSLEKDMFLAASLGKRGYTPAESMHLT